MIVSGLVFVIKDNDAEKEAAVPLKKVNVNARIVDMVSHVTITQIYQNANDTTIEAVYRFPMDAAAAVCAFECTFDERRIIGIGK